MNYLIDTNVLLRFIQSDDPRYQISQDAVHKLNVEGHQLRTTSQNLTEFWNVSTRPIKNNGFGHEPSETNHILRRVERLFPLLPDSPNVYSEWRKLVVSYNVSGQQVYDTRLVASMVCNDIKHILTFNTSDFTRYVNHGIVAVDPETLSG